MKSFSFYQCKQVLACHKRKTLIISVLGITMTAGAITGLASNRVDAASTVDDRNNMVVVSRLNALQTQLNSLQEAVNKPFPEVDLTAIADQIKQLSRRLETLKSVDSEQLNQVLTQTINRTESTLGNQLNSIKDVVTHLDSKKSPLTYLPAEKLPFKVVSVDSIQQVSVASIAYDFKTVPLEKGDSLAGWKVVSLDYGKQRIELENSQKERVLITHEQIG